MLCVVCCVGADDVVDDFLADMAVAVGDCDAVEWAMDATVALETDADDHAATRDTMQLRRQQGHEQGDELGDESRDE